MRRGFSLAIAGVCFVAAGCSPSQAPSVAPSTTGAEAPAPVAVAGSGAVISLTPGTVTIEHGPIDALHWGAKTTEFIPQDMAMLNGLKVGDKVIFQLSPKEPTVMIAILKM